MFKAKLSLLLIAIFLLNIDFLLSYPAFADEIKKDSVSSDEIAQFSSRFNATGEFSLASNPECGAFKTASAIAGIAVAIGAVWTGIVVIVSSVGIFTALVIVGMIAAFVAAWKAVGGLVVCQHSFVRHPVAHDQDGKYKDFKLKDVSYSKCTNKHYKTEGEYFECLETEWKKIEETKSQKSQEAMDGKKIEKDKALEFTHQEDTREYYWPKNSVQYSEYIEICHRKPFGFNNLFSPIKNFDPREEELFEGEFGKSVRSYINGELRCKILKAGQSDEIHGSTFKAVKKMGRLCVELASINYLGITMIPWPQGVDMGCTDLPPDPLAPMCDKSKMIFKDKNDKNGTGSTDEVAFSDHDDPQSKDKDYKTILKEKKKEGKVFVRYDNSRCFSDYVSQACYNQAGTKSLAPIPVTSMIVQCIKESLDNLVDGIDASGEVLKEKDANGNVLKDENGREKVTGSFISVAQKKLKNAITAVLVLALILFAIKVMAGGVRSPQEMYVLIIKFALVIYFTTGGAMQQYYGHLTKLSNGLSEIVLKASEDIGICKYDAGQDYEYTNAQGKMVSYSYLAPWDRLDCRILFYLGAPLHGIGGKVGTGGIVTLTVLLGAAPVLLVSGFVLGIIFAGGQILICFVSIFMAILMMMIILWTCYVFILSLVALSVIIILSPLFIPMVLFQHTKGYFDGWVKELITYSLYPVMLFAFLSFMFIACDKVFYKGLKFTEEEITVLDTKKRWFKLADPDSCKDKGGNETSLACMLQDYSFEKSSMLGLFNFTYMEFGSSLVGELLKLVLVLFLFYHFLNILPGMAAELAGNHRAALGSGATPGQMKFKALSAAKAVAGGAAGIASSLAKKGQEMMRPRSGGPKGN
ncbi:MAG: type IV secretion system protein [Wolbachia sp.]|nr:type IV secretion system protein [Wolbachia sp.]